MEKHTKKKKDKYTPSQAYNFIDCHVDTAVASLELWLTVNGDVIFV